MYILYYCSLLYNCIWQRQRIELGLLFDTRKINSLKIIRIEIYMVVIEPEKNKYPIII